MKEKNVFNLNDYFKVNYGLPPKPPVFKLKGWQKILYILIIPIIIRLLSRARRAQWDKDYEIRHTTWLYEFDRLYDDFVSKMNLKEKGMEKIGLVDEQMEVTPFYIYGNCLNYKKNYYRRGIDGNFRSDFNEITWFYFTKDQIFTFKATFSILGRMINVDEGTYKKEVMQEFFYPDIVSIKLETKYLSGADSIADKRKKANKANNKKEGDEEAVNDTPIETTEDEEEIEQVAIESFKLVVPGDSISYSFYATNEIANRIKGMRNLIRDKKHMQNLDAYLETLESKKA